MTYTYTWANPENTGLIRTDEGGNQDLIPTNPANRDYAAFVASGATAAPYVAPPVLPEPTLLERLESLGIDIDELTTEITSRQS